MEDQSNPVEQGRNWMKLGVLGLAAIPFTVKVAYLMKAWVTSPVDRLNIGLYGSLSLLFVLIAVAAKWHWRFLTGNSSTTIKYSRSLRIAVIPLILYVIGLIWSINALQLIASVGFLWAIAWALYGRESGFMLAPAAICAVLAVPGSIYWISRASQAFTGETSAAFAPVFAASRSCPSRSARTSMRSIQPRIAFGLADGSWSRMARAAWSCPVAQPRSRSRRPLSRKAARGRSSGSGTPRTSSPSAVSSVSASSIHAKKPGTDTR